MERSIDTDKLKRWLTLGENIGVLSGLILVALQINQNSEIAKSQLAKDDFGSNRRLIDTMLPGEAGAAGVND